MMKFLVLFRVVDPKHPKLIWFKPNLSLKIYIFNQVFQKKFKKIQKRNKFSIFFQFFFSIFKTILACVFANNEFQQRYAKVRPRTGHQSAIFFKQFLLCEEWEPLGFRAMSYRAPKIAVLPSKWWFYMLLTRSIEVPNAASKYFSDNFRLIPTLFLWQNLSFKLGL